MKLKALFKNLLKKVDDILCPQHLTCNLCGAEIFDDGDFCEACKKTLPLNDGMICLNCGRETTIPTKRCYSCSGEWAVDKARSAFGYKDGAEKLIKLLKYGKKRYLAEIIAPYLKNVYVKNMFAPDVITFVPMTEKKQKARGFNQAELIADKLAKSVDKRSIALLFKKKDTEEQKHLDLEARKENLLHCFSVIDKTQVKDKKILIVDDVLTTGATAHALAKVLKAAGAKSVYLLTVASVQKKIAW